MRNREETLAIVLKHWPIAVDEKNELVERLTSAFQAANLSEAEIERICNLISDLSDDAFTRGVWQASW